MRLSAAATSAFESTVVRTAAGGAHHATMKRRADGGVSPGTRLPVIVYKVAPRLLRRETESLIRPACSALLATTPGRPSGGQVLPIGRAHFQALVAGHDSPLSAGGRRQGEPTNSRVQLSPRHAGSHGS